jgi:hypothetical protein
MFLLEVLCVDLRKDPSTQHTDIETVYHKEQTHVYSTISAHKANNTTTIQEIIFFGTNVNTHQSTNTSKYATYTNTPSVWCSPHTICLMQSTHHLSDAVHTPSLWCSPHTVFPRETFYINSQTTSPYSYPPFNNQYTHQLPTTKPCCHRRSKTFR